MIRFALKEWTECAAFSLIIIPAATFALRICILCCGLLTLASNKANGDSSNCRIIITDDCRVDNIVFSYGINHHFHTRIWFHCLRTSSYVILGANMMFDRFLVPYSPVSHITDL